MPHIIKKHSLDNGIPVSPTLSSTFQQTVYEPEAVKGRQRLLFISLWSVAIAAGVSVIARLLVEMIKLVTNLAFYGRFSFQNSGPVGNHLGWWVIVIPALGGIVVGLMALYGSKAIRGHGIPEAMEQILTNHSKVKPALMYLKPLSSAIAIGTGGPFGAEGPIIATGGALGSSIGQTLKINPNERKILLAAGATAGMAAIFGSPVAAIFLAIELLLFEFSARSIIPVSLACITGAAGHRFFFGAAPVFEIITAVKTVTNQALLLYSLLGLVLGFLSIGITRLVYFIEDCFEKLPVHWFWWPAIAGLLVGLVGYAEPHTLGVGYDNITRLLNTSTSFRFLLVLFLLKLVSWSLALGSGTSGGTLAPLLTIGGAAGALATMLANYYIAGQQLDIALAALVGMSALFAGASRALLTAIAFAVETTGQTSVMLPLLAACSASYIVSFFLMENTIMTEKIARRGVKTPASFEPDILQQLTIAAVMSQKCIAINKEISIQEVRLWIKQQKLFTTPGFIVVSAMEEPEGIINSAEVLAFTGEPSSFIETIMHRVIHPLRPDDNLKKAVQQLTQTKLAMLPVIGNDNKLAGFVTAQSILEAYQFRQNEHYQFTSVLSLKRSSLRILVRGQQIIRSGRRKPNKEQHREA